MGKETLNVKSKFEIEIRNRAIYMAVMSRPPRFEEQPLSKGGARAREHLIEVAGEVFAEKGFQGATSREICLRAGVNLAAVNYHFGGFEALYIATLKEAHRRADVMPPGKAHVAALPAREKLRAFVRDLVGRLAQSPANSWEMRLVSREMVIPTFAQADFVATSIAPRRAYLKSIIGEIIDRPAEDPLVGRCLFTVIAPCIMLSITNRSSLEMFVPDLVSEGDGIEALVNHIERFVFAGLDGVAVE